jgi:ABC-type glycerol-3-phosphate transport system substrate-binding protein
MNTCIKCEYYDKESDACIMEDRGDMDTDAYFDDIFDAFEAATESNPWIDINNFFAEHCHFYSPLTYYHLHAEKFADIKAHVSPMKISKVDWYERARSLTELINQFRKENPDYQVKHVLALN